MKPLLFPREPRRMKQPAKDLLRQQLAMAADHIERVTAENHALRAICAEAINTCQGQAEQLRAALAKQENVKS
ncbi:hypothetical protein [Xanthomonas hortorum]|uniref:Uncharacterized protein n=1 Tax=Xanthomonas hortorum pv. vitians TaxID=83224 RepID=A0A6V7EQT3_9XANT|nr:hypothetical protein [Xanthomonas hortorum]APP85458.1 hypothetical protein BI317_16035 [Xanthomonas hortorum pv. gardneri]MCE4302960.1 hypothetical protein [Xanthomonas hortorum pv. vitians]MCE4311081.1 hypothetical protein [Xanthomonas hortorum pv. vitians]MCE4552525.1 hypothetical protein [Xanthomonas hortorum pv. vitians]MDT7825283.1 hypothetical protein [Xanthomonas hortorum pv. vitians]